MDINNTTAAPGLALKTYFYAFYVKPLVFQKKLNTYMSSVIC